MLYIISYTAACRGWDTEYTGYGFQRHGRHVMRFSQWKRGNLSETGWWFLKQFYDVLHLITFCKRKSRVIIRNPVICNSEFPQTQRQPQRQREHLWNHTPICEKYQRCRCSSFLFPQILFTTATSENVNNNVSRYNIRR